MRSKVFLVLLTVFMVCAFSGIGSAQAEKSKPQGFYMLEAVVKPCMVEKYEKAVKKLIEINAEHEATYPWYGFSGADFHYYFTVPIKDMADIQNMWEEDGEIAKKMGEELSQEVEESFAGTMEYARTATIYLMPELSYVPENPRLKPEERNFKYWVYYYIKPDGAEKAEKIFKKFVELCKSKGLTNNYNVYRGGMGVEVPSYLIAFSAKNPADYWTQSEKGWELLGEEGMALLQKLIAETRARDFKQGYQRPDLSYAPKKEEAK